MQRSIVKRDREGAKETSLACEQSRSTSRGYARDDRKRPRPSPIRTLPSAPELHRILGTRKTVTSDEPATPARNTHVNVLVPSRALPPIGNWEDLSSPLTLPRRSYNSKVHRDYTMTRRRLSSCGQNTSAEHNSWGSGFCLTSSVVVAQLVRQAQVSRAAVEFTTLCYKRYTP